MVVDSILQFMSQMDETVLALMDDYDDFYMIMKNNRGIHPIDLQKSIKRLYRSNKIRKSKYIRIMASASNTNIHGFEDMPDVLPVPHILDYDWRFSRQGLEYMANAVKKIIKKKNAVIVFLGAPTLFRYCYNKSFLHAKLVLVDINADKHSIGIDPNRALCINCNLNGSCTELLSIHADIVVMDPPWYLNYYQLFFDRAAIMSALDTQIMCIMPPKFTRAKTESETYSLLEMIKKDYGFVKKHYFTGVVTYHTPPYEQNVLKTNGIYCNPENWRIGDLLIVEKVYNVITTCTHDVSIIEPEWDGEVIKTRIFGDFCTEQDLKLWVCNKADPESKGPIENSVGFVKKNFFSARTITCIDDVWRSLPGWLERKNKRIHRATLRIPMAVFRDIEKDSLRSVLPSVYETSPNSFIAYECKGTPYVLFRSCRYSVPRSYAYSVVKYKITAGKIHIYDEDLRFLCTHLLSERRGSFNQLPEHRKGDSGDWIEIMERLCDKWNCYDFQHFINGVKKENPRHISKQLGAIEQFLDSENPDRALVADVMKRCCDNYRLL